ncbi:MAG: phage late control D family protein [Burkholderiaceae bacterium]|nr:phage late control D family protein [Burkholderiaceae bacterium]
MPETALSQLPIFSARPTLRLDGQEDERVSLLLSSMVMDESEGGMSTLTLQLDNWVATGDGGAEPAFGSGARLRLGARLSVYAGDAAAPVEIFQGKVSALEIVCDHGQPPQLVALAEDALGAARRARRSAVYTGMSPADVVQRIAGELGLTANVSGLASPVATWAQVNETDLGFLRRLLGRFDADLQVVGDRLQVAPRSEVQRGSIELAMYSQLSRVRITADLAQQATSVSVAGWNPVDGRAVSANASAITHAGPGSGRDGLSWASDALGARPDHLGQPAVATDDEARAVAEAALDQRARRFVRADGVAEGNARLRVGCHVRLSGVGSPFDNTYYVHRACHRFDLRHGYRVEFGAECAYLGN